MFLFNKEIEDERLVNRLKDGNHKAFETLFRRYYAQVCAYAARFVGTEDAEDIADDVMEWLWVKRERLDIQTSFRQYLYTMVYHLSCKVAKRNRLAQSAAAYMEEYRLRHELDESDFVDAEELKERIKKAIDALPETYRTAFLLHRFDGKTYKEIAEIFNLSPKTIDYRIQQALKQLRKELGDYLPAIALAVMMSYLAQNSISTPELYLQTNQTSQKSLKIHRHIRPEVTAIPSKEPCWNSRFV